MSLWLDDSEGSSLERSLGGALQRPSLTMFRSWVKLSLHLVILLELWEGQTISKLLKTTQTVNRIDIFPYVMIGILSKFIEYIHLTRSLHINQCNIFIQELFPRYDLIFCQKSFRTEHWLDLSSEAKFHHSIIQI